MIDLEIAETKNEATLEESDIKIYNIEISKLRSFKDNLNTLVGTNFSALADSIKERGMVHPLVVTPEPEGTYLIIDGNHRYIAAQMAGMQKLPCRILENVDGAALNFELTKFRGMLDPSKLTIFVSEKLERGTPLPDLARYLRMREDQVMRYYDLRFCTRNKTFAEILERTTQGLAIFPVLMREDDAKTIIRWLMEETPISRTCITHMAIAEMLGWYLLCCVQENSGKSLNVPEFLGVGILEHGGFISKQEVRELIEMSTKERELQMETQPSAKRRSYLLGQLHMFRDRLLSSPQLIRGLHERPDGADSGGLNTEKPIQREAIK